MKLKEYQIKAVDKLLSISKKLLEKSGIRSCVVKAPTGSGKTIIVAEWLSLLSKENLSKHYAFIWISGNNLHKQSKEKLQNYLQDSRYTLSYLEEINGNEFQENEISFVNWHSLTKQDKEGNYTNILMRDNENDRNLESYIKHTKEKGTGIILIVDESHYHYWSKKSQDLVKTVIDPELILEVSATPTVTPTPEELEYEEAGQITIRFDDVVNEGMIKKEIVINPEIGENKNFNDVADEVILGSAIQKRKELCELYKQNQINVNPLLLIQLPSEGEKTSVLDESKMEKIIKTLKEKYDITLDNKKLGIWLSNEKENLENIEMIDNPVEVLIFKQAIALGWDCPRAQLLVIFREIKSKIFEVQTVGRILRMPEAKHYEVLDLDRAYVYTNIDKIILKEDKDTRGLFYIYPSHRKPDYKPIKLPSIYLKRVDYGDLTLKFRRLFINEANKYFGIEEKDLSIDAYKKADVKLDLKPNELSQPVISDAIFTDIDNHIKDDIIGVNIQFTVSEDEVKNKFETFAKLTSLPFAPIRSCNKIQMAIYDWFDNYLGYKGKSRLEIQRIIVCSENNQKIFKEIIETAKIKFKEIRQKEIEETKREKEVVWDIPAVEYFNEGYVNCDSHNYAYDKCYLQSNRSQPEKDFEELLNKSQNVEWWFKNGVEKEVYFAVSYVDPDSGIMRGFYPDYVVYFKDKFIGIYDTKSGITAKITETTAKSDALQSYIDRHKNLKLKGGIIQATKSGMYLFIEKKYNSNINETGWIRLEV